MSEKTGRIIENVTLVEVRPGDGAQLYKWGDSFDEELQLCAWNRADNVKVGDKGRLVYRSTASQGLYWFEKNETK